MKFSKKANKSKFQTLKDIQEDLKNEKYHARLPTGIKDWSSFYDYLEKTQRREGWKV